MKKAVFVFICALIFSVSKIQAQSATPQPTTLSRSSAVGTSTGTTGTTGTAAGTTGATGATGTTTAGTTSTSTLTSTLEENGTLVTEEETITTTKGGTPVSGSAEVTIALAAIGLAVMGFGAFKALKN